LKIGYLRLGGCKYLFYLTHWETRITDMRDMEHGQGNDLMPVWAVITLQLFAVCFAWIENFFSISSDWVKELLPFLQLVSLVLAILLALIKLFGKDKNDKEKEG
jgi:hypothetical protein